MRGLTDFQEKIAVAWALAEILRYDSKQPKASPIQREQFFLNAVEEGVSVALRAENGSASEPVT